MTENLAGSLRRLVAEDLAAQDDADLRGDDRREYARQRIFAHLDDLASDGSGAGEIAPTVAEEQMLAQSVLDALFGMGRLQALIDDPRIENIDINGCDRVWATFADGSKRMMEPIADSDDELVEMMRSAASRFGLSERRFDMGRPELDLRLPDGSRLSALMAVSTRPCVSIRRHRFADLSISELIQLGTLDEDIASLLSAAVRARKNIVVAGAMNSGKTTLMRALAAEISPRERIVTIEQAFELGLENMPERHPDMVALEARPANVEGEGLISVADLVRRALRMNADRVIVGEVLGDEILPMLNAMSQGRSGSMCTIHANSSDGAFRRIASYAVQAPERLPLEATNLLIAGSIHFVVFLDSDTDDGSANDLGFVGMGRGWDRPEPSDPDGEGARFSALTNRHRFVSSVREVVDAEGVQVISNEVYCPGSDRRAVAGSPLRPQTLRELSRFGYESIGSRQAIGAWR
ncbi:MAG TPA: ATPase, T2SS/T4P/T4SS family [Acidimicrobiales bacterium]|jgi:Flp pilus assembly CpaF family ATPase